MRLLAGLHEEVRRYGWVEKPIDPETGKKMFEPLEYSWRVEAAHAQVGRSRRLAKSFQQAVPAVAAAVTPEPVSTAVAVTVTV